MAGVAWWQRSRGGGWGEVGRAWLPPARPCTRLLLRSSGSPASLPVAFDEERILPSQWEIPQPQESGAQRLARAVLEQALHDLKDPRCPFHSNARRWFAATARDHLFTFELVCETLGFDAGIMRQEVFSRVKDIARRIRPRWRIPA